MNRATISAKSRKAETLSSVELISPLLDRVLQSLPLDGSQVAALYDVLVHLTGSQVGTS
jgi:hypothetical protein